MPTVLGVNLSPFVRKVRVALAEKGVSYELDPVFPQATDAEFRRSAPSARSPRFATRPGVLRFVGDLRLPREEASDPALYPSDRTSMPARSGSRSTATRRWWASSARRSSSRRSSPRASSTSRTTRRSRRRSRRSCRHSSTTSRASSPATSSPATQLSIADIGIGSMLVNLLARGRRRRHAAWPKLARYVARIHERPSFKSCIDEEQRRSVSAPERRSATDGGATGAARPLAVPHLALQREGALGARLEGRPAHAASLLPGRTSRASCG